MDNISPKEVYSSIVQFVCALESSTWNRFYNYLMGNSILILAWATVFASNINPVIVLLVLASICFFGGLSGLFWSATAERGKKFMMVYLELGKKLEENPNLFPKDLSQYKHFTENLRLSETLPKGWGGSYRILKYGPLSFTILYVVLLLASILRYFFIYC